MGSLAVSMAAAFVLVPVAIQVAWRTRFLDVPQGYKGHADATPYLGGAAVVGAFALAAVLFGGVGSELGVIAGGALVLFAVGTVDDRHSLGPGIRVAIEVVAATVLWASGLGWGMFGSEMANLLLTVVWVVGLVNAFNLMDNMDGAAATVGAVSAGGTAIVALAVGEVELAALLLAMAGACVGFLPFNLARPSRIFLGDGGSMPLGFVIAASIMALPFEQGVESVAVLAAAPLVGLPILDTALVVVSRIRRRVNVFSGGRDHLTHRLRTRLGSARIVALSLALAQAGLCAVALGLSEATAGTAAAVGVAYVLCGAATIYRLETPRPEPAPAAQFSEKSSG